MSIINKIKFTNLNEEEEPIYKIYMISNGKKLYIGKTQMKLKAILANHVNASYNYHSHHYLPRVHDYFISTGWDNCIVSIVCEY